MKARIVFPFAGLALLLSCQQTKHTNDPENLKKILFDYFEGVKTKDLKKLNDATTDNFVLFEDGKVWNNDSLITALNKYYVTLSADFTFDNFRINVDNESGNMSYFNHCECIINDTSKMSFNWIESASFVKVDGKWKMNFLHSSIKK